MSLASFLTWVVAAWLMGCGSILFVYRAAFGRLWREPVFRLPILVLESDDWGAGPDTQAEALRRLADLLARHRDACGRAPVLNLALILAVPDGPAIRATGAYRCLQLDDPQLMPVRAALSAGLDAGVFAFQLHGMEHYWPAALMASHDAAVQAWRTQDGMPETEQLPSHLQSRWVNATVLPSVPHAADAIHQAVAAEVAAYRRLMGEAPQVVVPPTFVWTREVETAWAAQGVTCIVTPGVRYTRRGADGGSDGMEGPFVNGQRNGAVSYVVRTDYFEPKKGRDAAHALAALDRDASLGRPCILENHRDNFCRDEALRGHSEAELDALLKGALVRHPGLRFLSTHELFKILRACDREWIVIARRARLPAVWERVRRSGRLWKLLRLSGAAAVGSLLVRWLGTPTAAHAGCG